MPTKQQKAVLVAHLEQLGIRVNNGKVRWSDIKSVFMSDAVDGGFNKNNLLFRDVLDAFATCYNGPDKDPVLQEKVGKILLAFRDLAEPLSDEMKEGELDEQLWIWESVEQIGRKDWRKIAKPSSVELRDPSELIYKVKPDKPAGYLLSEKVDDWHKFLGKGDYDNYAHVVENYFDKALSPGITINGRLYDGGHRCQLAYGLNIRMPVVDFKI